MGAVVTKNIPDGENLDWSSSKTIERNFSYSKEN